MRILYCNKYNFRFSGTESYLFEVMDLVRRHGHEAALFSMADPRGEPTPFDRHFVPLIDFKNGNNNPVAQLRGAFRAIYSVDARRRMRRMIAEFRPDVAHVRNIYHHLTPSILWELKNQDVPVLYHLNDFKLICPSYNMVSHGKVCERCHNGKFRHVLTEGCYSGRPGSALVLAAEAYVHKWLRTYPKCVDCLLAPSAFVKNKLAENGWDSSKIEVLPHFQTIPLPLAAPAEEQPYILYFGRLSAEKGVHDLLLAMQALPHVRLQIAGDGAQRRELEEAATNLGIRNVNFLGHLQGDALHSAIGAALFTVLPSRAYETLGKAILESYAHACAVVASDLGSRRELVLNGRTGLLFQAGDVAGLARAIAYLVEHPQQAGAMGKAGREVLYERHAPEAHYGALLGLYERLQRSKATARRRSARSAMPKLRVAFIGGRGVGSKYSGIETYYEEAGSRLVDLGYRITVYCRSHFTPPLKQYRGMRVVRLPTIRSKHLETPVHTFLSTLHALLLGHDIVHYHALGSALFSFIPRLFKTKTMVTVQGLDWQRKKWSWLASNVLRMGEHAAFRLPNVTIVVSRTLQRRFRICHGAETVYIPNGTNLIVPSPRVHGFRSKVLMCPYILFLGRLSPEKNCHLLIAAYEKLETPAKLILAGGTGYLDAYNKELHAHASGRIHFLDWVAGEDREDLLRNAMLLVQPSDIEGLSLVLLEAMGAGVCVLASDIPENCEIVDDVGFTFRHGDVADLGRALSMLINNPRIRLAAARRALIKVRDNYLWPDIAVQIDEAYRALAGRGIRLPPIQATDAAAAELDSQKPAA